MDTSRMATKLEPFDNGWHRHSKRTVSWVHRRGWRGRWDRLVAFILRREQKRIMVDQVFSVFAKGEHIELLTDGKALRVIKGHSDTVYAPQFEENPIRKGEV